MSPIIYTSLMNHNEIYYLIYLIVTWSMLAIVLFRLALKTQIVKMVDTILFGIWAIFVFMLDNNLRCRIEWGSGVLRHVGRDKVSILVNDKMDQLYGSVEGWIIVQGVMLLFIIAMHVLIYKRKIGGRRT
jgi:hypothetical protein